MRYLSEVTIVVPTTERPDCLDRLLSSIRVFYPDIKVTVSDSGEVNLADKVAQKYSTRYIRAPIDCGVSSNRNILIDSVETELMFFTDDDTVVTEATDLNRLLELKRASGVDLLSIGLNNFGKKIGTLHGNLELRAGSPSDDLPTLIRHPRKFHSTIEGVIVCDVADAVFLADRRKMLENKFEPRLKAAEILEFYYRAWSRRSLRVGWTKECNIDHWYIREGEYLKFFSRNAEYCEISNALMGIKGRGVDRGL